MKNSLLSLLLAVGAISLSLSGLQSPAREAAPQSVVLAESTSPAQRAITAGADAWRAAYPLISSIFVDAATGEIVLNVRGSEAEARAAAAGVRQLAADTTLRFRAVAVGQVKQASAPHCLCQDIDSEGKLSR
ncbi:hypothetical protein GCM10009841_00200 [Microlunatus panaciterrae]|uniref:BON domain-containing protein n=1 Tax=Microlunatus panaciterrae TaxID=400768 RepID=A0ABS2RJX0_9ACTN|nr:hypothetical protein [Microlunatus panaciterrae]MBM7799303.1 hypothetical protein [Microlunatus panaciterrae]